MEGHAPEWFWLPLFLLQFVGMWLFVTALLNFLSGWSKLANAFPDDESDPLQNRMRFVSGNMGSALLTGVSYGNCLILDVCKRGLKVRVWRIFGPFSAPFHVPWTKIEVRHRRFLAFRHYQIIFGDPEVGQLTVGRWTGRRIAAASNGMFVLPED